MKKPPLKKRVSFARDSREANKNLMYWVGLYSFLGFQIVAAIVGGVFLGSYLDEKLATSPLFLLVGVMLAMVVAGYQLYRLIQLDPSQKKKRNK